MGEIVHNFNTWVYSMWEDNCSEREAYNQQHLTLKEYSNKNKTFLHDEYIFQKEKERNGNI